MRRSRRGSALLETALAFPVLALMVTGVIDYGRVFSTNLQAGNAARAGAQVVLLEPERFQTGDLSGSIREVQAATDLPDAEKLVTVERFSECPGTDEGEQPYPAACPGAAGYLRVKVSLPLSPMFRYPQGAYPAQVTESAIVRLD